MVVKIDAHISFWPNSSGGKICAEDLKRCTLANSCASQRVEKRIPAVPVGSWEGNWRTEKGPEHRAFWMAAQGSSGILKPRDLPPSTPGRTDGRFRCSFLKTSPKKKEAGVILNIISRKTCRFTQRPPHRLRPPPTNRNRCNPRAASTILHYHTWHVAILLSSVSSHGPFLTTEGHSSPRGVELCRE